ncbi:hypothetical protein N657DRAFT_671560 [Parathielavia appendiculata]|uniref:Uncharacterized protein n=1 Tax=Parathielavia appendiculata TaxID=2587402 RepID=A0AAN6U3Y2_9PEZI|nr:hypothetical protein N657DRAFT_671560 [Parathielavia appendiculata]
MAGPRAPIGTLSQHAAAAAGLVRNMVPKMFTSSDPKRAGKTNDPVESDSDSESDTDSDTSETDVVVNEETKSWADKIKAKKAASTPVKAEPAPATSPKTNTASAAVKLEVKKPESSESSASESESESDSGSEDEDAKMDVDLRSDVKKAVKEEVSESEAESESSDEEMADPQPVKKKASPASASEADSASEDESSDDESVSGSSGAKVTTTSATATKEASASDDESASESESEGESAGEVQPSAKSKSTAQSESDSENESASDSEDEPEPSRKPMEKASAHTPKPVKEVANAKKPAPVNPLKPSVPVNGAAKSKELSREFVSKSDGSSAAESSGSESEDESAARSLAVEKQKGKAPSRPPAREVVSQGFTLRKAGDDVDAAAVAQVFKKAKAEGKQIWYFTTPKSVPIEVIQKHAIPLEKIHSGRSIFAHEGAEYTGQFEESINHAIKVLIPGKDGSTYETMNQSVDRVLHITRVTLRGDEGENEPAPDLTSSALVSAPRPQPKGLKARYLPFGVTNGDTGNSGADVPGSDEDVEMAPAPPLLNGSAVDAKSDSPKKAAKKRKLADVEKGTPSHEEPASTPAKKPKKARIDSKAIEPSPTEAITQTPIAASLPKVIKQTPIAPPPVPPSSAKSAVPSEPAQSSPAKKSKGKDKPKKKDSASTEKSSDLKKPSRAGSSTQSAINAGISALNIKSEHQSPSPQSAIRAGIGAVNIKSEYQSMSEKRKAVEAARVSRASTPSTPSKPPSIPTKSKIAPFTPVPIPGATTPRRVIPDRPWPVQTPNNKAAQRSGTPSVTSQPHKGIFNTPDNKAALRGGTPPVASQPLKGILKAPERGQFSGGKAESSHPSGGRSKSEKRKQERKRQKLRKAQISWTPDTKRGHGSH